MYDWIRKLLFTLQPETAHHVTLSALQYCPKSVFPEPISKPFQCMGLTFPNRVGLAAGLDKNGDYLKGLSKLGFGFIEIGTVTPKRQLGNPKPRLFRLPKQEALINRMGFNNKGVDYLVSRVQGAHYQGILGINIGKNKDTPNEQAVDDYLYCLERVYPHASYITVNISSPNTPGLRDLQEQTYLKELMIPLKKKQQELAEEYKRTKPLLIKIAPDLSDEALKNFAEVALELQIDGIIATNTTNQRPGLNDEKLANEVGGLSGGPLKDLADSTLVNLHRLVGDAIPIIGVGGIMSAEDGAIKFDAGASLLQIYTGLIYHGPQLVHELSQI